jgi:hypothetical protein
LVGKPYGKKLVERPKAGRKQRLILAIDNKEVTWWVLTDTRGSTSRPVTSCFNTNIKKRVPYKDGFILESVKDKKLINENCFT